MEIQNYLDSTYLKTPAQSGLSEEETLKKVYDLAQEAVENGIFAVMIRPEYVKSAKEFLVKQPENQVKIEALKFEFLKGTELCLRNHKVVKWIIEIAALTDEQIAAITKNIVKWANISFPKEQLPNIFIKSSTGFYITENGKPNGATKEGVKIMLDNAGDLSVKAAGGVRTPQDAEEMLKMGVKRIGTSSALALLGKGEASGY